MRAVAPWLIVAAGMVPGSALANCLPSFDKGPAEVALRANDSMDSTQLVDQFRIVLRNDGDSECRLTLRLSHDPAASDPSFPDYTLTGPGGSERITAAWRTAGVGTLIVVPPAGQYPVDYTVSVPVGWGLKAGDYVHRLRFSVSEPGTGTDIDTNETSLRLRIPATARIRFAGAVGGGGETRIDLGELSVTAPTVSPPFALRVLSTSAYQVQFMSQFGGRLVRSGGTEAIPYQMRVNGRIISLATGDSISAARHTSATGDIHRIQVIVAADATAHAGNYTDRVTVTVTTV